MTDSMGLLGFLGYKIYFTAIILRSSDRDLTPDEIYIKDLHHLAHCDANAEQ